MMSALTCTASTSAENTPSCGCGACLATPMPDGMMQSGTVISVAQGPIDTVPADTSTGVTVSVGASVDGVVNTLADHDWFAVDLVAGTRYIITMDGLAQAGYGALIDPYLRFRNALGVEIAHDDDSGPGRNARLSFYATTTGRYFLDAGAWDEGYTGGYRLAITEYAPRFYTLDQIAAFLTEGYWGDSGHHWDISTDHVIAYNITALTSTGQNLARAAFQAWANVTDLVFQEVSSGGDMLFDDNASGAFAAGTWNNGLITSMTVNISTGWLASYGSIIDSYSFQTYVHEIGHALGLGHGGPYNGSASYGVHNIYANDVWSYTIMSYFDQAEAGFGSYRYVMGPSIADILAVQNIYGANTSFNAGNTVYGSHATAGSLFDFKSYTTTPAFTIYDAGGADTLDASGYGGAQIISLEPEVFSSIGDLVNNIVIARGVVIEAAIGGDGADSLIGNAADNRLMGEGGADTLLGGAGRDVLLGGAGNDSLVGGADMDWADYTTANHALIIDLTLGTASGAGIGSDHLQEVEAAIGGAGDDSMIGGAASGQLIGNGGADTLIAPMGEATLDGGAGDDVLLLGQGDLAALLALFST